MSARRKQTTAARIVGRLPGLRRLPIARLLAVGELIALTREHLDKLHPHERRRIIELLRVAQGRPSNLSAAQREELRTLVQKAEPRLFVGTAAEMFSPLPLPGRVVRGPRRK